MMENKICKECNVNKTLDEFAKKSAKCKICMKEYYKKYCKTYYEKNKSQLIEKQKVYNENNKTKIKEYMKDYYTKNKN